MTTFNLNTLTWKTVIAALFIFILWQNPLTNAYASDVHSEHLNNDVITQSANDSVFKQPTSKAKFLELVDTDDVMKHSLSDLNCMAKNIYYEARNESKLGKFAVAQVTINRTKDPKFAGNICKVVYSPNQFSWANNHHLRNKSLSGPQWEESKTIAKAVLSGTRIKGMEYALYFHATHVNPRWRNVSRLVKIGGHVFYRRS